MGAIRARETKHGRNEEKCKAYAISNRRLKNKKRRLIRELKKQPNNRQVANALAAMG